MGTRRPVVLLFFLPFSLLGVGRRRVKHSLVPFHLHDALGIQVQLCKATRRGAVPMATAAPRLLARRGSSPPAGSPSGRGGRLSPLPERGAAGACEGVRPPACPGASGAPRCRPLPTPPLPPRPRRPLPQRRPTVTSPVHRPDPDGNFHLGVRHLPPPRPGSAGRPRSAAAAARGLAAPRTATRRSASVHAGQR